MLPFLVTLFVTLATDGAPAPKGNAAPPATSPLRAFVPVTAQEWQTKVLAPHRGRVVVVNFWASYCEPCLHEMPALLALKKFYGGRVDFVFVSADDPAQGSHALSVLQRRRLFLESFIVADADPAPFLRTVDETWQGAVPLTVLYGPDGAPLQKLLGEQTTASLSAAIEAALRAAPAESGTAP